MVHETLAATNAIVVLDVPLPAIFWGWIITMNMWAKSIGTGIIFLTFFLLKKISGTNRFHPFSGSGDFDCLYSPFLVFHGH